MLGELRRQGDATRWGAANGPTIVERLTTLAHRENQVWPMVETASQIELMLANDLAKAITDLGAAIASVCGLWRQLFKFSGWLRLDAQGI